MIHVCFGLHDKTGRYSKFTGTAMLSIFENLSSPPQATCIHILHDNTLTDDNRDKFIYLAVQYGQLVRFYNVEELCAEKVKKFIELIPQAQTSFLTVGAMYRLLIPQILTQTEKIIYLDSDIVVNLDLNELWQIELGNAPLAAVPHVEADCMAYLIDKTKRSSNYLIVNNLVRPEDYFNSGVMIMNLKVLRREEKAVMDGIKFVGEHPQLMYLDQEVLNFLFSKDYLKVSNRFNRLTRDARLENNPAIEDKIYHYAGRALAADVNDKFNRLWFKYFIRTPWFDEDSIGRLYDGVQQLHVGLKQSMINISTIMSGKMRAFFILPENLDAVRQIFSIHDDEKIILAANVYSIQDLFCEMKTSEGKKVFFILVPNFPFGILIQAGFTYRKDFINGFEFLSEVHGVPLNSHELIKAM